MVILNVEKKQAKTPQSYLKYLVQYCVLPMPLLTCLKDTHVTVFSEHRVEYNCYHYTAKRRNLLHFCYFQGKTSFRTYISRKRAALAERLNLSSVCLHLLRGLLLTGMTKASQL